MARRKGKHKGKKKKYMKKGAMPAQMMGGAAGMPQ